MILAYSAIKINVNLPDLYSVLNPETNSDSPSEKSYGVRLVSAKLEANQIKAKGKKINKPQQNLQLSTTKRKFNEHDTQIKLNKTTAKLTS